jgi:hypothetical protein
LSSKRARNLPSWSISSQGHHLSAQTKTGLPFRAIHSVIRKDTRRPRLFSAPERSVGDRRARDGQQKPQNGEK